MKKKLLIYIILLLIFPMCCLAKSNPYPHYEDSPFGGKMVNCTWFAWQQAKERMGVELPTWYYVYTWANKAKKAGYTVSMTPKAESIMILDYNKAFNTTNAGGHAAYVIKVDSDKVTYIEGGNALTSDGIAEQTETVEMLKVMGLQGFIYLDEVPKTTTTTKKSTTTKKATTTKKTSQTSSTTKLATTESTTTTESPTTTETTTTTTSATTTENKEEKEDKGFDILNIPKEYIIIAISAILLLAVIYLARHKR